MLDLLRQEVDAQVANLKQNLTMLKQQPGSPPDRSLRELEDGQRALKTIDALAQVVGVEAAATVAGAIQANLLELLPQRSQLLLLQQLEPVHQSSSVPAAHLLIRAVIDRVVIRAAV
ncbi:hypothetical protein [Leptolyngbya ohadii]|uniref:hypothetical protein n=1 Tax=Leptolyngbya ohadii TaxID=1962290 RepID=UPI0019D41640|nr:hypothetical protein [Leptolyngbya ohadii]